MFASCGSAEQVTAGLQQGHHGGPAVLTRCFGHNQELLGCIPWYLPSFTAGLLRPFTDLIISNQNEKNLLLIFLFSYLSEGSKFAH